MGNSSKKEKLTEKTISSNEQPARVTAQEDDNIEENNNPTGFWSPVFNEYCFGDSPDDVNDKLPVPFSTVEWITLAIAYEYKLDEVRYFFVRLDAFDELTKFVPPHMYVSPSSFVCFMFTKKKLFRISIRLLHDDRALNYRDIIESYARAVNTPLLSNKMFHYEDERIFYYSSEQDDHTVIETIEKGRVFPDGQMWNPFPSDKIEKKSFHSSNSDYLYDLMISYSHQDKDLCHRIYSKLVADGFNVWVDLENMYGSTIDRMAEAIENSQFILICMSQRYETSPYCKTEGQYTYKLQRPFIPLVVEKNYRPKSWLGALVGLRMYIDFTKYDFDVAYDKLRTEVQRNKS
ncbi:unnamed protein product [Adineta steineri]|uniref:TIR domain-containing protein n=1 Tax=Adineta steineri TaxID=433720 RepID=A0A818VST3_9BILA|nr:unnamed protein product [Adineta steineri]CAF3715303.1 unnamed protein product [Adineta steineri]CAF3744744.1 unnamed protein product [Adineta steineri]